jgi:hypothetical protein
MLEVKANAILEHYNPLTIEVIQQVRLEDDADNNEVQFQFLLDVCKEIIVRLIADAEFKTLRPVTVNKILESKYDANVIGWSMPLDLTYLKNETRNPCWIPPVPAPVSAPINLLVNGDFSAWTGDNPDGWIVTENSPANIVTEVVNGCRFSKTAIQSLYIRQNISIPLEAGKTYEIEFFIDTLIFGSVHVSLIPVVPFGAHPCTIITYNAGIYIGQFNIAATEDFIVSIEAYSGVDDFTVGYISLIEI